MATVAIGDLHGCLEALDELLTRLQPTLGAGDEVVFLGDYIDDGPDISGCVSRLIEFRASVPCPVIGLMGNHEQWMLRSRDDPTSHSWLLGMNGLFTIRSYSQEAANVIGHEMKVAGATLYGHRVALSYHLFFEAMPEEHREFFDTLQVFHQSSDVLCVHGGCADSDGSLDELPPETLIWGPPGFPETYMGERPVVYGHHNDAVLDGARWPHPRVTRDLAFGIDTIRHGVLTAIRFPDKCVFQSRRFLPIPHR